MFVFVLFPLFGKSSNIPAELLLFVCLFLFGAKIQIVDGNRLMWVFI
jgi:hypothetical protein